jgi:outer membrane receptor protein involved in Fe transport
MYRKACLVLMGLMILPALLYAGTTGKIRGRVTDSQTSEPLPGANVVIEGTTLGAATDLNGDYVILNVPVGSYAVRCMFIGYRAMTVSSVRVNVDLTTELNFPMPAEAIAVGNVEIIAERPLVNKNATNSQAIRTAEEIENLPIRSYAQIVNLAPGVVDNGTNTFIRGGRAEETAYYVDGVYQNSLRTGFQIGDLSANAVEEVSVQAGGFNAEYGFASSGVVNAITKSGGAAYNLYGEYITDEWLSKKEKKLGTFSYGHNVYNLAISGPVPFFKKVNFYLSGERDFLRDNAPSIGIHPALVKDVPAPPAGTKVGPENIDEVIGKSGPLPNNALGRYLANGNLAIDLNAVKLKIGGNATYSEWSDVLSTHFSQTPVENMLNNLDHVPFHKNFAQSFYAKATHAIGAKTFYSAQVNLFQDGNERFDPILKRDVVNYGDKTDVNKDGVFNPNLRDNGSNPIPDATTATIFNPKNYVFDDYFLNRSGYWGFKGDLTHQIGRTHELKVGGEYRYHTLRRYYILSPLRLASAFGANPNADKEVTYMNAFTEAYGYKLVQDPGPDGELVQENNSKFDKAKHPILFAFYLQDKIEVSDLVLNFGLRVDHFDANDFVLKDPLDIKSDERGLFDRTQLKESKASTTVSPRLGFAFPVTDRTVFYGQFGKFTQQPQLLNLYTGWEYILYQLQSGNYVNLSNPELEPTKTTSYEAGFRQQIGEVAALDIAVYYKETRDLIQLTNFQAKPAPYASFVNGDYGTIKGLSLNLNLRRTSRVAANLSYTFQQATSTGSTANTGFFVGWLGGVYPTFVAPTDFDQRHTGSLNLDIRLNKDDGPAFLGVKPFANMGINLLFTFGSGFAYTPRNVGDTVLGATFSTAYPRAAINSAYGPWHTQLDLRLNRELELAGVKFDVFLWALNLLNTENINPINKAIITNVYGATGSNFDNGYLDSPEGKVKIDQLGGEPAANLYRLATNTPDRWAIPRQLRLGLRFDLNPTKVF